MLSPNFSVTEFLAAAARGLLHPTSLQAAGDVLVQHARDEGLVGNALFQGTLLEGFEVLAGDANVDAPVLAKGRLEITLGSTSSIEGSNRYESSWPDRARSPGRSLPALLTDLRGRL